MKKLISIVLVIAFLFGVPINVFAVDELFPGDGVLHWQERQNGAAYLKIAQYNLSSDFSPYFSDAASKWSVATRVDHEITTYAYSTVDIKTASYAFWVDAVGEDNFDDCGGFTFVYFNGTRVRCYNVSLYPNINYASTWVTPVPNQYYTQSGNSLIAAKKRTIVHEIGHALCLGHCYCGVSSVMRDYGYEGYYSIQAHDILNVNTKYS